MRLEVAKLYPLQVELDQRIYTLHDVSRAATLKARQLALLVELGECANETRCFKYWSLQEPAAKEIILEEYGDGIHFLLSLGIDLNDQSQYIETVTAVTDLTTTYLEAFLAINQLIKDFTLENYLKAFQAYLNIAVALGFTEADIIEYYLLKNQKNHDRQDQGY